MKSFFPKTLSCVNGLILLVLLLLSCSHAPKAAQATAAATAAGDSVSQQTAELEDGEPTGDDEAPGLSGYEQVLQDISELPKTAVRTDSHQQYSLYVNEEQAGADEAEVGTYSVWLADERAGTVLKVCQTNPTAAAQWERMKGEKADAVDVPMQLIATAERAYFAPGDVSKIIVEGCPDARNVWTYIIDTRTHSARQMPTTEGVVERDWEKKEIIAASYGYYDEGGRYTYSCAYSTDGKFLRVASEKVHE